MIKISISIPTLNRQDFLSQCLKSIFKNELIKKFIEINISNNFSNQTYNSCEKIIERHKKFGWNINYVKQKKRLSIDEHMLYVTNMANAEYIYFLGDDDYFCSNHLSKLIRFIETNNPDLSIFNGKIVDKNNKFIGNHFKLRPKTYSSVELAYEELRDKGTFGSILIKKKFINTKYFKALFNSSHAYGCFWIYFLNNSNKNFKIIIPDFFLVYLRSAEKHYNQTDVFFVDIINESNIYFDLINNKKGKDIHKKYHYKTLKMLRSVKFLMSQVSNGFRLKNLKEINSNIVISSKLKFNYRIAKLFVGLGLYNFLIRINNNLKRRREKEVKIFLMGGFGNILFQLLVYFYLIDEGYKVTLITNMTENNFITKNLGWSIHDKVYLEFFKNLNYKKLDNFSLLSSCLKLLVSKILNVSFMSHKYHLKDDINKLKRYKVLCGYFQAKSDLEFLMEYKSQLKSYIKLNDNKFNYIAHLRMTDSPTSDKNLHLLIEKLKYNSNKILVLTDEESIKDRLNFDNIIIESNSAKEDFLKLCSSKNEIFCSNSTFSWWASHFVSDECVVYMPDDLYFKYGYYGQSKILNYENCSFS